MDDALRWWNRTPGVPATDAPPQPGVTARFGGDQRDEPVLLAVLHGLHVELAQAALADAALPAYVKVNTVAKMYGLSSATFGRGEVWVHPQFVEQAREVLIGIGVFDEA